MTSFWLMLCKKWQIEWLLLQWKCYFVGFRQCKVIWEIDCHHVMNTKYSVTHITAVHYFVTGLLHCHLTINRYNGVITHLSSERISDWSCVSCAEHTVLSVCPGSIKEDNSMIHTYV